MRPKVELCLAMALMACTEVESTPGPAPATPGVADDSWEEPEVPALPLRVPRVPTVVDVAQRARVQSGEARTLQLGRACVAADFDDDGLDDLYVGNPGDTSYVLRNNSSEGEARFEAWADLMVGSLAWGAAAADFDNDGDVDLFVGLGGNEGVGLDRLYVNQLKETGVADLVERGEAAGIQGPAGPDGKPLALATANGVWGDLDLDGDLDLFVNANESRGGDEGGLDTNRVLRDVANPVWINQGDGTFVESSQQVGLGLAFGRTRHSTLFDYDNDGDLDLYENNFVGPNRMWKNLRVETGTLLFTDVTSELARVGADLSLPFGSFASASADFNQDGWEDLIVFVRRLAAGDCGNVVVPEYQDGFEGHRLYLNAGAKELGFVEAGDISGLNMAYYQRSGSMNGDGVMGSQVGDLDGNGFPDVYLGNGAPEAGETDRLYMVNKVVPVDFGGVVVDVPQFADWTSLVDFPATVGRNVADSPPPYPYRTHGSCMADLDGDGRVELFVSNGGPAGSYSMREPDRLFDLTFPAGQAPDVLPVRLVGDGVGVPRTAVGSVVEVRHLDEDGVERVTRQRLYGGSGFSGQNGSLLHVGLGFAREIVAVTVRWTDGHVTELRRVPANRRLTVYRSTRED